MYFLKDILEKENCRYIGDVEEDLIKDAQIKLDMKFPNELIEYLKYYGTLVCGSKELNGLGTNSYLNIVQATLKEREINTNFPDKHVVLQSIGIEGLLILIDENGCIYEWTSKGHYKKIYDSLKLFFKNDILK